MKKLWKENKIVILFAIVVTLILLVLFLMIYPLYSTRSGNEYGDRLEGIKEVAINDNVNSEIKSYFESTEKVKSVKTNLKGKLYNITLTTNDGVSVNEIADISDNITTNFDEEQLKLYDIQIFISSTNENETKSIVGYKSKNTDKFIWTNNR